MEVELTINGTAVRIPIPIAIEASGADAIEHYVAARRAELEQPLEQPAAQPATRSKRGS